MEKTYSGTFNLENLAAQLYAAFPTWKPVMIGGRTVDPFYFTPVTGGVTIGVPDGTSVTVMDATVAANDPNALTVEQQLYNQIVALAQSAVGVTLSNLTAAQIKALMAVILFKMGGVDPSTMTVKALNLWV